MNAVGKCFIGSLFSLLLGSATVFACSCNMDPNPPCRSVGSADAIFEGAVLEREKIETDNEDYTRRRFTVKVKKIYKGSLGDAVFIYTGNGDSDCGYRFEIGSRYLIYASEYDGRLSTNKCTRTSRMKYAKEDADYLSRFSSAPSGATIFGKVYKYDSQQSFPIRSIGFPKVRIEINGPEKKTTLTDEKGSFSVAGLVAGQYNVNAETPEGFVLSFASRVDLYPSPLYVGEIADKGCLEVNLVFERKKEK